MKIVFDTNVLLSGVFTRGVCEALLDECLGSRQHEVLVSQPILDEFVEHATKKFHVPAAKARRAATTLRRLMTLVVPVDVPKTACRDPDDLVVLGTFVAAGADCLVTGDKDLLILKQFEARPILTPRQFFDLLTAP